MPFKTPYGTHYHMTEGCCNAHEPCGTEGLLPCSICCGNGSSSQGTDAGSVIAGGTGPGGGSGSYSHVEEGTLGGVATPSEGATQPQSQSGEVAVSEAAVDMGIDGVAHGMSPLAHVSQNDMVAGLSAVSKCLSDGDAQHEREKRERVAMARRDGVVSPWEWVREDVPSGPTHEVAGHMIPADMEEEDLVALGSMAIPNSDGDCDELSGIAPMPIEDVAELVSHAARRNSELDGRRGIKRKISKGAVAKVIAMGRIYQEDHPDESVSVWDFTSGKCLDLRSEGRPLHQAHSWDLEPPEEEEVLVADAYGVTLTKEAADIVDYGGRECVFSITQIMEFAEDEEPTEYEDLVRDWTYEWLEDNGYIRDE